MHNAPSVSYPVGRCAFQRCLYVIFVVCTSAVLFVWALNQSMHWVWAAAVVATGCASIMGARALNQTGTLTWDGQVWCWHDQACAQEDALGEIQPILDLQKTLLLRWQPASDTLHGKSAWLWLGAEQSSTRWQDLRRAVYQRADIH